MTVTKLAILGVLAVHALACNSSSAFQPQPAQPTSAQIRPGGSPSARTVDNAGFVDPAGQTRQVSAGSAPAPVGGSNSVPPPQSEWPVVEHITTTRLPPASSTADRTEATERAARALCDRETECERVGKDKGFESADACMTDKRDRVRQALSGTSCRTIRGDRIADCLTAIRAARCGPSDARVQPPTDCTERVLCGP